MNTEIAFWDASAILLLCCSQIFTTQSKKWLRKYPKIFVWWGTSVELNSGLARLKRSGHLTEKETIKALRLWEKIRKTTRIVSPVERVIETSLITVSQHLTNGVWLWRVHYGARDYIGRRGGDLMIDLDGANADIKQILRGQ